jgi:hypothetical protein
VLDAHAGDALALQPLRDQAAARRHRGAGGDRTARTVLALARPWNVGVMARRPRDRDADRGALRVAADRVLAGTPLRWTSVTLTATELIAESGLRRDVV